MFKRKPPYSQEEIGEQIYQVGKLIAQYKVNSSVGSAEVVIIARETLLFMLDSVQEYNQKHDKSPGIQRHGKIDTGISRTVTDLVHTMDEE